MTVSSLLTNSLSAQPYFTLISSASLTGVPKANAMSLVTALPA
ncbi:Uncharacterised protein [Vibrio cholerae]|nr:Uncharacterised protein [Vibrio cholerae]